MSKPSESETIRKILTDPLDIQSFDSFFLLVIGLCGATVAAWDGYKFDDPFPGFGRRHRRYLEARRQCSEVLGRIVNQSNTIVSGQIHSVTCKIEDYAEEIAALLSLHQTYCGEHKGLTESLDEAVRQAETEIACRGRLSKMPPDNLSEVEAIAAQQLPGLSAKQIRVYESHEKKLKALRKDVLKEHSSASGIFETASTNFEALMAGASQAALHSPFAVPNS